MTAALLVACTAGAARDLDAEADEALRTKCDTLAACDLLAPDQDAAACIDTHRAIFGDLDGDCRAAQVDLYRCLATLPCDTLANERVPDTACADDYDAVVEAGCVPDVCLAASPARPADPPSHAR